MPELPAQSSLQWAKNLADVALERTDPTGWFETLYAEADRNPQQVPWARLAVHPHLRTWLDRSQPETTGKSALVVGCGLGDDAEALAELGFQVTAFDISPTAIAWCCQRFPASKVHYQVADLFKPEPTWQRGFDFVLESRTIQSLPLNLRTATIQAIAHLVAPDGILLVIARSRNSEAEPGGLLNGPPWPLSDAELSQFQALGLTEVHREEFRDETHQIAQWLIEYRA